MMGYAKVSQVTRGIHTRQFSRTFIVGDNSSRVAIVTIDSGMVSQIVKLEVVRALKEKFGDLYTEENVLITATHTHATLSIERAHNNVQPGYIYWNIGEVHNASINRSPTAYNNNPEEERSRYKENVDKRMFLLKFTDIRDKPLGTMNWFAVHPTSMNSSNTLISGDNKGVASLMFEQNMNGEEALPGKGPFVAAFAQSNAGDVSPNIFGARCPSNVSEICDIETSTCKAGKERCIAIGPGHDMFESTWIIGRRQYKVAKDLFKTTYKRLAGPVLFIHQFIDMSNIELEGDNETERVMFSLPPAVKSAQITILLDSRANLLWASVFAAGTIDCPGEFDFLQGTTKGSTLWNIVVDFIRRPSKELKACQAPKPILLATGEMSLPYKWQPDVVPTQIVQIGNLAILGVPAEITTMAGRRLRDAVQKVLEETSSRDDIQVVLSSLSNAYSSYVATFEEYQVQR
ncbi:neutral ceramidase [Caerostris extrusa]|uniref:Neutral ceramidase n=1 Tax=Caerostris extrusa TaxID=172846 RepID=A0AAV4R802_CAEEX|nr:neutral ceramidase [Caerostris extrusa]